MIRGAIGIGAAWSMRRSTGVIRARAGSASWSLSITLLHAFLTLVIFAVLALLLVHLLLSGRSASTVIRVVFSYNVRCSQTQSESKCRGIKNVRNFKYFHINHLNSS